MKRPVTALLLLGLVATPASAVIDPFYRNRMESGVRAFDRGDWEEASRQLRIACFGHLDEPVALAEGLIRLAMVKVELGDEDAFRRIFSRLIELEERFTAYTSARLPAALKRQFESRAARLIPIQTLESASGFHPIAERAAVQSLATLPPDERRMELESRIAGEPERLDWQLEMVRLELELRRPQAALDLLDRLPQEAMDAPPAICLRQQAASEDGSCDRLDLGKPFCRNVPASVVEFRLQCLVDEARWPEAASLLAGLDSAMAARKRIARLQRRVQSHLDPAVEVVAESPLKPVEPDPLTPREPAPPPASEADAGESSLDPQTLERLRARLAAASAGEELEALAAELDRLVVDHPSSRQARLLAAETAYLRSDWPAALEHFSKVDRLRADESQLAFYQAVALYETGDRSGAAAVLRPVVSRLERTAFVESYVSRILEPGI